MVLNERLDVIPLLVYFGFELGDLLFVGDGLVEEFEVLGFEVLVLVEGVEADVDEGLVGKVEEGGGDGGLGGGAVVVVVAVAVAGGERGAVERELLGGGRWRGGACEVEHQRISE